MVPFPQNIIEALRSGGIGVIPTDTVYGLVGRAERPETVGRIYAVRKRNPNKPAIILISSFEDLAKLRVEVSPEIKNYIETHKLWPGKVSIIFPALAPEFEYLTRGTQTLAFRIPDLHELRDLLKETSPLIAPSANFEGEPTAITIDAAQNIFHDSVDFYVDGGELVGLPSTLITFESDQPVVLRQGAVEIE